MSAYARTAPRGTTRERRRAGEALAEHFGRDLLTSTEAVHLLDRVEALLTHGELPSLLLLRLNGPARERVTAHEWDEPGLSRATRAMLL